MPEQVMDIKLIVLALWGGLVSVDNSSFGQFMISRPLVACSIAGYIFGDVSTGVLVGIVMELLLVLEVPVGGSFIAHPGLGGLGAATVALEGGNGLSQIPDVLFAAAIFVGLGMGYIAGYLDTRLRLLNHILEIGFERAVSGGHSDRGFVYVWTSLLASFLMGMAIVVASEFVSQRAIIPALGWVPASANPWFGDFKLAMAGLGAGMLTFVYLRRGYWLLFLLCLALSSILLTNLT